VSLPEREIQAAVRRAVGALPDVVLWRNTVGKTTEWSGSAPRHIAYGLAPGSADLVGILAPAGRFVALEIKRPGERPTPEQETWLALVRKTGGFAAVVHSAGEALSAIERARAGGSQ
jgi:hypothetical protein